MANNCVCDGAAVLTVVGDSPCEFHLKQIQRIVFQRAGYVFDSAGVPTPNSINALSSWTPLLVAVDATLISTTPLIGSDPKIDAGEAIMEGGGDNTTLNGVENVISSNPSKFSVMFNGLTPAQEKALKAIMCFKDLVVYFVTEENKIVCKTQTTTQKIGIPIQAQFVGDRSNQGFGTLDKNMMSFSLKQGWSEDIELITPAVGFNPLTDLAQTA